VGCFAAAVRHGICASAEAVQTAVELQEKTIEAVRRRELVPFDNLSMRWPLKQRLTSYHLTVITKIIQRYHRRNVSKNLRSDLRPYHLLQCRLPVASKETGLVPQTMESIICATGSSLGENSVVVTSAFILVDLSMDMSLVLAPLQSTFTTKM
jgi:hypothetical protein